MPTPTYDLIASTVLSSSAATVTFSSIPQTYGDLVLVTSGIATPEDSWLRFNGDAGSNYNRVAIQNLSGSVTSSTQPNQAKLYLLYDGTNPSTNIVQIFAYTKTDRHKSVLSRVNYADSYAVAYTGRWASNSAINSITIGHENFNFNSGSTFHLYGIAS